MNADRVLLRAVYLHLGDTTHSRNALRHDRLSVFIQPGKWKRRRSQRNVHNRLIRRIHFLVTGRTRHVARQLILRSCDRGLDILRGRIQTTVQSKLQYQRGKSKSVCGAHRFQTRNRGELFFQRRRNCRCHGFRTGAGKHRGHLNGWKIYVGKIADRKKSIRENSKNQNRCHDQSGHDGTPDKYLWKIHDALPELDSCLTSTFEPGSKRS